MDNDDLPDAIVQPLAQLGRALVRHAQTHRDTSLAEHEEGELAGVEVGSETLRTQAERIGTELEGQQRRAMAEVEATHEPPGAEHDPAPGMLVVETDGVMVRYRDRHLDGALVEGDWHEVKL